MYYRKIGAFCLYFVSLCVWVCVCLCVVCVCWFIEVFLFVFVSFLALYNSLKSIALRFLSGLFCICLYFFFL